jgi:hypothetical protein
VTTNATAIKAIVRGSQRMTKTSPIDSSCWFLHALERFLGARVDVHYSALGSDCNCQANTVTEGVNVMSYDGLAGKRRRNSSGFVPVSRRHATTKPGFLRRIHQEMHQVAHGWCTGVQCGGVPGVRGQIYAGGRSTTRVDATEPSMPLCGTTQNEMGCYQPVEAFSSTNTRRQSAELRRLANMSTIAGVVFPRECRARAI